MIAGLPITGIGGMFYLLLAFCMPFIEFWRLLRGRSSRQAWAVIGRQTLVQTGVLTAIGAQAALIHWLSPSAAQRSQEFLGINNVENFSQSQTAGLIAGTTIFALATLICVSLLVYSLRLYFQIKRSMRPATL
jgi:hypothetical protein